jgi:hypothetical protein
MGRGQPDALKLEKQTVIFTVARAFIAGSSTQWPFDDVTAVDSGIRLPTS